MRIIKSTLAVAWFVSFAVLLAYMFLHITMGSRPADHIVGIASGTWCLTTGLFFLAKTFSESGLGVLEILFSIGWFAMGVVSLSASGLLPDIFRVWAGGVFLICFALMVAIVCLARYFAAREEQRNEQASPRPGDNGWTTPQLALVLMVAGVISGLAAIKCLVFGPPPYSPLAYIIGPVLIVAGYLVDPHAIRNLRNEGLKPPEPPTAEGG